MISTSVGSQGPEVPSDSRRVATVVSSLVGAVLLIASVAGCGRGGAPATPHVAAKNNAAAENDARGSCFLLHEIGVGEVRRAPSSVCRTRVTPASTFKIPHALAALDAGVIAGPDTRLPYDGSEYAFPSWKRDHTLASAMQNSVAWYFLRIAHMLGVDREREYLRKFSYGNADSGNRSDSPFWLGGPLLISPEEQEAFLVRLYKDDLPVSPTAMQVVRDILVQPPGVVVNSTGEHPFGAPWPEHTVLSAKTGGETGVRWLVGHVRRERRAWVFVSCVIGEDIASPAAIDLAARTLHEEGVP